MAPRATRAPAWAAASMPYAAPDTTVMPSSADRRANSQRAGRRTPCWRGPPRSRRPGCRRSSRSGPRTQRQRGGPRGRPAAAATRRRRGPPAGRRPPRDPPSPGEGRGRAGGHASGRRPPDLHPRRAERVRGPRRHRHAGRRLQQPHRRARPAGSMPPSPSGRRPGRTRWGKPFTPPPAPCCEGAGRGPRDPAPGRRQRRGPPRSTRRAGPEATTARARRPRQVGPGSRSQRSPGPR